MSGTLTVPEPATAPSNGHSVNGTTTRDKEILLAALAKDVLSAMGRDAIGFVENGEAIIVKRVRMPVDLDGRPVIVDWQDAEQLHRRIQSLDRSETVMEFEVDLDEATANVARP